MNRFLQILLGIEQSSPGVETGGDSRLELASLPRGIGAIAMILAAVLVVALLAWLYRREGRNLSRTKRAVLVGLRVLTLLAVVIMLLEPVLVSTRRETVPSQLPIIVDDSESMRFSDPYTDNSRTVEIAASLKLQSENGKAPVDRLRETPRLGLVQTVLGAAARGARTGPDAVNLRPGVGGQARLRRIGAIRKLEDMKPNRPVSPLGDALHGVLAAHRGQPVAGVIVATDGRSNTGEEPLRAVEAAARRNIPTLLDRRGGRRGAAEYSPGRDRGQPGGLRT